MFKSYLAIETQKITAAIKYAKSHLNVAIHALENVAAFVTMVPVTLSFFKR